MGKAVENDNLVNLPHNLQHEKSKDSEQLAWVISCMVFLLFIVNLSSVLGDLISIPHERVSMLSWGILGGLLIFNIFAILRNLTQKLLLLTYALSMIFLVNYMFVGDNPYFLQTVLRFIFTVYPLLVVYSALHNYEYLYNQLVKISKIILVIAVFALRFSYANTLGYRMGYSYSLQLPVILMLCNYYRSKEMHNLILALAGAVVILLLGARGPLLGILAISILLYVKAFDIKRNMIKSVLLLLLLAFVLLFGDLILQILYDFGQSLGIQSRSLILFLNADAIHLSSREFIYQPIIQSIIDYPFFMHGIAGEYAITGGAYAHNFVLELLYDFGIFFGGLILIYIFFEVYKTLQDFMMGDSDTTFMRTVLLCASLPGALVSGTIWESSALWVWLFMLKKVR